MRPLASLAVTEVWALPGYDVQSLIGYGATGEVWRARVVATGEPVALKRLRDGADPAAVDALRREALLLRSLDTPYVVRLREIVGEGEATVLVLDLAAGGSLATVLAERGRLDPGEVVTVAAPIAQALAAAHARGLVHSDVTPANILFTADGMPLLADLGVARIAGASGAVDGTAEYVDPAVAAGAQPDFASDVWGLAAVCHHMLSGTPPHDGGSVGEVLDAARSGSRAPLGLLAPSAPRPLVSAVEAGLQADPGARPDAAELAALLRRSHAAAPVRLHGAVPAAAPGPELRPTHAVHAGAPPAPAPPAARRWTPPRRLLIGAAAVLLLALAATAGWVSARGGDGELAAVAAPVAAALPSASPSPSPTAAPSWSAVLDRLDAGRAAAFAAADARLLSRAEAPGSLLSADTAATETLRAQGRVARGVRHTVRRVTVVSAGETAARLSVTDELSAYDIADGTGRVVQRAAPRGAATFTVVLVRTVAGWRLQSVSPASRLP